MYGENKRITDGNYDKSLAVKCINGTYVGKKTDERDHSEERMNEGRKGRRFPGVRQRSAHGRRGLAAIF